MNKLFVHHLVLLLCLNAAARAGSLCGTLEECRTTLIRSDNSTRAEALEQIKTLGKDAVPMLAGLLNIDDKDIRAAAEYGLREVDKPGPEAVPALTKMLRNDPVMRRYAAITLGKIGPASGSAAHDLLNCLKDADSDLSARIIYALGRIGPAAKESVPALVAFANNDPALAPGAIKALAGIGPDAADAGFPVVLSALSRKNTRFEAAEAIAAFGPAAHQKAKPELSAMLKGSDNDARLMSIFALGRIGPAAREFAPLIRDVAISTGIECEIARRALASIDPDPKDLPLLRSQLRNFMCMRGAAAEMVAIGTAAVPSLVSALSDTTTFTAGAALSALGSLGPAAGSAVPAIAAMLSSGHGMHCMEAAHILGKMGPSAKAALPALLKAYMGSWIVNCQDAAADAIKALSPAPEEISDALAITLKDGGSYGRDNWEALTRFGPKAAHGLIRLLTDQDKEVRYTAGWILGKFGPDARDAVPALIQMLKSGANDNVSIACAILANIGPGGKEALPALKRAREGATDKAVIANLDKALAAVQAKK